MKRYDVTLHRGGRITIPAEIRQDLQLRSGDSVIWFEKDGQLCFRKAGSDERGERSDQVIAGETTGSKDREAGDVDLSGQDYLEGTGGDPETPS